MVGAKMNDTMIQFAQAECHHAGHACDFVAKMAAMFMDPDSNHSLQQAFDITKVAQTMSGIVPQPVANAFETKTPTAVSGLGSGMMLG